MEIGIIYFFVIIFSNTIGAISGMGGGVIIRPIFDAIGYHNVSSISFYSSLAVFTMSIVSTARRMKSGMPIKPDLAIITSLGSIIGGMLGNILFEALLQIFPNETTVQGIQINITIVTLIFSLAYTRMQWKSFNISNKFVYFLAGGVLGGLASLLGIGGGPINVAVLMYFFGIPIKDATVYSIITIFFSQLSRLITVGITTGYQIFDLTILGFIVPAAIIGGLLGAKLGNVLPEKAVTTVYQMVIVAVIILNMINGIQLI